MLNSEDEFLSSWEKFDFSRCNEMDIREDFIAPLLYILGYSKNTINDIVREKSLCLSEAFHRIGRKKVQIDYVPSIRLKSFWIMEAKPGNPRKMTVGDMLQAHLYAVHPEIQVPYIVLTNGWELKIYSVYDWENWKEPFFEINAQNCRTCFSELKNILSAKNMLQFQRSRMLEQIKNTFEVEIDEEQFQIFCNSFRQMQSDLKQRIEKNARKLRGDYLEKQWASAEDMVHQLSDNDLMEAMNSFHCPMPLVEREFYRRFSCASAVQQSEMLDDILQSYQRNCISLFKIRVLEILLWSIRDGLGIKGYQLDELAKRVVEENLNYAKGDKLRHAWCFLEQAVCRLAAVIVKADMMEYLSRFVDQKKESMPVEERICENPTVSRVAVLYMESFAESLWKQFSRLDRVEDVYGGVRFLDLQSESILQKKEMQRYPDNDDDLLFFENHGEKMDQLFFPTCIVLERHLPKEKIELPKEIQYILNTQSRDRFQYVPALRMPEAAEARCLQMKNRYEDLLKNAVLKGYMDSFSIVKQNG